MDTKHGEEDLDAMSLETYNRQEKLWKLQKELLAVEGGRMAGKTGYTLSELDTYLDNVIAGV